MAATRRNVFEMFASDLEQIVQIGEDSDLESEHSDTEQTEINDRPFEDESDSQTDDGGSECVDPDGWRLLSGEEITDTTLPRMVFTGRAGISEESRQSLGSNPQALDFVNLFIPPESYEGMQRETNRYAQAFLNANSANMKPSSRFLRWKPISLDDMKAFLTLTVAMGLLEQEALSDYWTTNEVLATPFFPSVMARDQFFNILSFFHLCNNENYIARGNPGYDPMKKLGSVYTDMKNKFRSIWQPAQYLTVDEGMVPFRGKVHFRVYAPDKPNRYGLKCYQLCDSQNGYCCEISPYVGKSEEVPTENGRTYDIVRRLTSQYEGCGRILFVDNYYTSPTLFSHLLANSTGATGTSRQRKGMPERFKNIKLKQKGDMIVMTKDNMLTCLIKDSKQVTFLSTVHSARPVFVNVNRRAMQAQPADPVRQVTADPVRQEAADPVRQEAADPVRQVTADPVRQEAADPVRQVTADPVRQEAADPDRQVAAFTVGPLRSRPEVMNMYNMYMGAVDRSDQMVSYMSFCRRTVKWWKKLFFHIFSLAVLNAYIVQLEFCKTSGRPALTHKSFRRMFVQQMISSLSRPLRERRGRLSLQPENLNRLNARHYPTPIEPTGAKKYLSRVCLMCSEAQRKVLRLENKTKKRVGHETRYECLKCGVNLCLHPCFMLYHEYSDYTREYERRGVAEMKTRQK